MTTPEEFLQFAEQHGLDVLPSTSIVTDSTTSNSTGLVVLNNICHLIEQLHTLKLENHRLRAQLDLVNHVEKFLSKSSDDEEKLSTFSPANSMSYKNHRLKTLPLENKHQQGMLNASDRSRQDMTIGKRRRRRKEEKK
jgi:hypothetical protein